MDTTCSSAEFQILALDSSLALRPWASSGPCSHTRHKVALGSARVCTAIAARVCAQLCVHHEGQLLEIGTKQKSTNDAQQPKSCTMLKEDWTAS